MRGLRWGSLWGSFKSRFIAVVSLVLVSLVLPSAIRASGAAPSGVAATATGFSNQDPCQHAVTQLGREIATGLVSLDKVVAPLPGVQDVVAVAIFGAQGILLGQRYPQRLTDPLRGFWSTWTGKVDPGELLQEAARREVEEEIGVRVGALSFVDVTLNTLADGKTFRVFLFFTTEWVGTPQVNEAEKMSAFAWSSLEALPAQRTPEIDRVVAYYRAHAAR